jgi:hypothetical protein
MEKHFLRVLFHSVRCFALAVTVLSSVLPLSISELAYAQNVIGSGITGDAKPHGGSGSYTGPGDIQAYKMWGSCAFVYNASLASTGTSLCDLVASGNGASVCTLRGSPTGAVDLASSYCASTTPSAACAAANGGSCAVSKVYDQTGNGNPIAQSTLAKMPALTFAAQNSLPCMSYNGAVPQWLASATFAASQSQPTGASFMAKRTSQFTTDQGVVVVMNGSYQGLQTGFPNVANEVKSFMGANVTATATDNAFHAANFYVNGGSSETDIDGTITTGNAGTNSMPANAEYQFGFDVQTNDQPFYGVLCEGGYMAAPNTTNFPSLNSNIHSRWSF